MFASASAPDDRIQRASDPWRGVRVRISDLAAELRLDDASTHDAFRFAKLLLDTPRGGETLEAAAACAVLLATRIDASCPQLTLKEVAARVRCAPRRVSACWMRAAAPLRAQWQQSAASPARLLERFAGVLRLALLQHEDSGEAAAGEGMGGGGARRGDGKHPATLLSGGGAVLHLAQAVLHLAEDEWLTTGRAPSHLAAAALLLSVRVHSLGAPLGSPKWVAAALPQVSYKSLVRRVRELDEMVIGLVRELPESQRLGEAALRRSLPLVIDELCALRRPKLPTEERTAVAEAGQGEEEGCEGWGEEGWRGRGGDNWGGDRGEVDVGEGLLRETLKEAKRGVVSSAEGLLGRAQAEAASEDTRNGRRDTSSRGPPAFLAAERKRARLQAKLDACRNLESEAPEHPLDREERAIRDAVRRGVPQEAILQGHFHSVGGNESNAPQRQMSESLSDTDLQRGTIAEYVFAEEEVKEREQALLEAHRPA